MPPPRPRGASYNSGPRPSANAPMSERQQMALLMQMAANSPDISRSHSKKNEHKKTEEVDEVAINEKDSHDQGKEKGNSEDILTDNKKENHSDHSHVSESQSAANTLKRNFSDMDEDDGCDDSDDVKKKKRKDSDTTKETKAMANLRVPCKVERNAKQTFSSKTPQAPNKSNLVAEKEHSENIKSNFNKIIENDGDDDDLKMSDVYNGGLKVPPLKIVIPQQNLAIDTDGTASRTGKVSTSRNAALPYVVSSNNEINDREAQCGSPNESPQKPITSSVVSNVVAADEKHIKLNTEDKNLHRVLRSSHRQGGPGNNGIGCNSGIERSSNNSSPQMQSSSPSPASSNHNENIDSKVSFSISGTSPSQPLGQSQNYEHENIANMPSPSTSSTSSSRDVNAVNVELHPRKRKIRSKNDDNHLKSNSGNVNVEVSSNVSDAHPHDFPFTNCFQMYLNIRRQIENKWKNVYPIKPRPPQGFNEYLINKKTYLLFNGKDGLNISIPRTISTKMTDIFIEQERERKELLQRHTVEREKLCLNVEQEIIRVHSKAARNISCQSIPYSVCTLFKDEEVYNIITPEQEEKDRNTRRFNGRLLLSWLQDVEDKWEKIKESMLLRHHNEAESLHAVQSMNWKIALKKYRLWDFKTQMSTVDAEHVPIVAVSDELDLLPA